MARQITDTQRQITVPFPEKRVNWKRLMLWIVLACVVVGGSVGGYYLYDQVTSTVIQPPPVIQPPAVTPATPTENQTSTIVAPTPQKVFFAAFGDVFWPLDPEGKRFVAYTLGYFDIPGPGQYPLYSFPIAIKKFLEGKDMGIIGTMISDPNIDEVGRAWETVINDVGQNVACRVKLTRVDEEYKYKIEFFVSPDGGNQWFPPTTYPAN